MIRPVFTEIVLFLAPFAAYLLFLWVTRAGVLASTSWTLPTIASLTIVALALMIVSFLLLAEFSGAPPGSTYEPARVERGRIVPGAEK
jgi:hypothetical protein